MATTYYYFDNAPVYQADWQKTIGINLQDGVICGFYNDLFCYGDASGMQVKVKSGAAHIKGNYFFSDEETILLIGAAPGTAGQSRYDVIVCEVDWTNKIMELKVVAGTASTTPSMPSLTKISTVWQIPLARVAVTNGDTNVPAASVYDLRAWALGTFDVPIVIGNGMQIITTGPVPVGVVIPTPSRIVSVHMIANEIGSITADLWKKVFHEYPPTITETIIASGHKPALASARIMSRRVWTEANYPNLQALDWPGSIFTLEDNAHRLILLANLDSATTVKMVNMTLRFARMISPVS